MNKKNIIALVFVIVLIGTAVLQFKNSIPEKKVTTVYNLSVKQSVLQDGKKSQVTKRVRMGTSALQLLSATHKVITKGEKENAYITSIDGRIASTEAKEFWSFYVNGKQAQVGAGSYIVKNNDTIEWKIETY